MRNAALVVVVGCLDGLIEDVGVSTGRLSYLGLDNVVAHLSLSLSGRESCKEKDEGRKGGQRRRLEGGRRPGGDGDTKSPHGRGTKWARKMCTKEA